MLLADKCHGELVGIAYRCDTDLGCTFVVWDGNVTPEEWRAHRERLLADPAFSAGSKMFADLSRAGGAERISTDAVTEMASVFRADGLGPYKVAVIPNGAWDKARHFEREVEGSGITVIVFNDVLTAGAWLGIEVGTAATILGQLRAEMADTAR